MDSDDPTVVRLFFDGEPYGNRELDAAALAEIVRFQELVTDAAAELWRARHPEKARLPAGFSERTRLVFGEVETGSSVAPLRRPSPRPGEMNLPPTNDDDVSRALVLLHGVFEAAERHEQVSAAMTPELVTRCSRLGSSLADGVALSFSARGEKPIAVSQAARTFLAESARHEAATDIDALDQLIRSAFSDVRDEHWENLPVDSARRLDEYLYRRRTPPAHDT